MFSFSGCPVVSVSDCRVPFYAEFFDLCPVVVFGLGKRKICSYDQQEC